MNVRPLLATGELLAIAIPTAHAADAQALYATTCIVCHGKHGEGAIPGIPDLGKSRWLEKADAEPVSHTLDGFQSAGSATAMPAKGGNPVLTADDAAALVAYLRQLATVPK